MDQILQEIQDIKNDIKKLHEEILKIKQTLNNTHYKPNSELLKGLNDFPGYSDPNGELYKRIRFEC